MSISYYKITKWYKMLTGQSISHVNQDIGTCYLKNEIAGYYNDLTEKVTKDKPEILVPKYHVDSGEEIFFSIGIFQYGLAAYDLYLKNGSIIYKNKFLACANWAIDNQQNDGSWITFAFENIDHPYSAMAQGEGISMLIRAHKETGDSKYLDAIEKAKSFMLKSIYEGGTTDYCGSEVYLYECTHDPLILNGWIFSLWGLFDYCKYIANSNDVKGVLDATIASLIKKLPNFDIKYWSKYEDGRRICSPFYHRLHIAQLRVMYDLFENKIFLYYADKWEKYQNNFFYSQLAFWQKVIQKVIE